jgi:hypothetical protein
MSTIFKELKDAVTHQYEHGELPKWLAEPALDVADNPERYSEKEHLIEILIAQVNDYDVYAEAGCCKWAYDHEDIARTLKWLEAE